MWYSQRSREGQLQAILKRMPQRRHHTKGSHTPPGGVRLKLYSEILGNKNKVDTKHRVARGEKKGNITKKGKGLCFLVH